MGDPKSDGDQSSGSRRRRAPNFTDNEIRILVKLVFSHMEIIESKKTDSETWRVKDLIWKNICENFNNCPGTCKRTVDMIRQKYDSLKKLARKKDAKNKEEVGKDDPDFVEMEDYEKELIQLLESQGGNTGQTCEAPCIVLPMPKVVFDGSNIKTEHSNTSQSSNIDLSDFRNDERFIITDEDMLWDLPTDTANRPRLQLVKKQFEQLEQEEQRQIIEHKYRMRTQEIKRKVYLGKARRAREEHKKKMELLELEIELKRKLLAESKVLGS